MSQRVRFEVRVLGVARAETWRYADSIPEGSELSTAARK